MLLMDVNIFVYAYREDSKDHVFFRDWLQSVLNSDSNFGYSTLVLSGFLRIVTHPKIFETPSPYEHALSFCNQVVEMKNAVNILPSDRHWDIFTGLLQKYEATGNIIPDLYHAALAIESGSEWVTTDKGFIKIKEIKTIYPKKNS